MTDFKVDIEFQDQTFTYTRTSGLLNFSLTNQSMTDNKLPNYDIINAYGSVEIMDSDSSLYDYLATSHLKQTAKVKVYLTSTDLSPKYRFVSTKSWNYDIYNKTCKIELVSDIVKWQNINVEKRELSYDQTAYQIYQYLVSQTTTLAGNYTFTLDSDTQTFLGTIVVPYFYLEKGSLWEQWRKFCQLTQCQLYQDIESNIFIKRYQ